MLGSSYNFVLQILAKVNEIIAVPGHTYNKVAVFLGMFLCFFEQTGCYYIELDMMAVESEICSDK